MHTVGILGHNGLVGAALLPSLVKAHQANQLKLVVLHRATSDVSKIPSGIEKRVIDLAAGVDAIKSVVKGINILLSPISTPQVLSQLPIVEALVGSPDLITYIPSEFGTVWTKRELAHPKLGFLGMKDQVTTRASELGVPVTQIRSGFFDVILNAGAFSPFGINVKTNKFGIFRNSRTVGAPITTLPYLAAALTDLIVRRTNDLPNKTFDVIEYNVTGQDFIDAYAKVHEGVQPEVTEVSEDFYTKALDAGGLSSLGAGIMRKWGDDDDSWRGERIDKVHGWTPKPLAESLQSFV